ncbi:MAG: ethanolamine utilization protein EutH [Ruminococcaceae bacterium]|nr:ethanolamine utilization protein EutH [Oscillospiraceae bacterium]
MNFVSVFMTFFAILGALDRIFGCRFKIGKEFERGFYLFGNMALSMIGMLIVSPLIADVMSPVFDWFANVLKLDPSIIPASLFANDMGGASLSKAITLDKNIGMYNALVVSSMMGCTISFTIPYALNVVKPEHHKDVLIGFLCGIVTIPIGCFVGGLFTDVSVLGLLFNLLPLILFAALIAVGLLLKPMLCVKIFSIFGKIINIIIIIGLCMGIIEFLITKKVLIKGLETYENAALVCVNAATVMAGAFPFIYILSKLVNPLLKYFGKKLKINETAALGFVSSLATSVTTFDLMGKMDKKGRVLNSAFTISAAFVFAGHLAFTLAFDTDYILPMIIGKLVAGIASVFVALFMYKRLNKEDKSNSVAQ